MPVGGVVLILAAMDRVRVLLLILLVAGACLSAWLLSAPYANQSVAPTADELPGPDTDSSQPLTGQPLAEAPRLSGERPEDDSDTRARIDEGQNAPGASGEQSPQPAMEPTEPVLRPIYGPAVQRGGAVASFNLVDAKDQPLIVDDVSLELWRRVGVRWISEEVRWATESRTIWCRGSGNAGLEPGEYELEVRSKVYGSFRHTFRVNKDERLDSVLRFETWRRIICFDFRQIDERPINWIHSAPTVTAEVPAMEALERASAPGDILREPPPRPQFGGGGGRGGKGGFAYRRARGGGGYTLFKRATDGGRYYVPVIAGIENTVRFGFNEAWGTDKLEFVNLFTGPEWDSYTVTLDLVHDFDQLTAEWKELGTDDPGARSLLNWIEQRLNPPAIDDPAAVANCRLVLELEALDGLSPVYAVASPGDAWELNRQMPRRQGVYYVDAGAGQTVWFGFKYLDKLVSEPESHTFTENPELRVHRIQRNPVARMVATPAWDLSPTLNACMIEKELVVSVRNMDRHDSWRLDLSEQEYPVFEALRDQLRDKNRNEGLSLDWRYNGDSAITSCSESENRNTDEFTDALDRGDLRPPKPAGLVLRAIGPEQEGLPWVEASVVDYEQDERARRLREVETALTAQGKRPKLGAKFGDAFYSELQAEKADAEFMREHVGEEFLKLTSEPDDLDYYARRGAWYDSHRRLKSDSKGYLLARGFRLTEGRVYVLYLWSNSRDDLKPDARVVFRAEGELTDLGAILLPTYTE